MKETLWEEKFQGFVVGLQNIINWGLYAFTPVQRVVREGTSNKKMGYNS